MKLEHILFFPFSLFLKTKKMATAHGPSFMSTMVLTREGVLPTSAYVVENLSCKPSATHPKDYMTLRVRFLASREISPYERVIIKLCPSAQFADRRNQGRPECGFVVGPLFGQGAQASPEPNAFYETGFCCSVVLNAHCNVAEIYFSIEDCNYDFKGPPKWIVVADASAILAASSAAEGRWHALKPVHPNPDIEETRVPCHEQPQRTPRWFGLRDKCAPGTYEVFGGKLSASKVWAFIGGDGPNGFTSKTKSDFAGNAYTRFGRDMEPCVALALLVNRPDYHIYECGTFMHPTLTDVCAAPDGIIDGSQLIPSFDAKDALPAWYKKKMRELSGMTEAELAAIDWTRGVFECKVMMKRNKKEDRPMMKAEYLCQMYLQMACAGCWWGDLVRYCAETRACFRYRVYRMPDIAAKLDKTIERMRREIVSGAPHMSAADHETNHELVKRFTQLALAYNTPDDKGNPLYQMLQWPQEAVDTLMMSVGSVDMIHSTTATTPGSGEGGGQGASVNNMQIDQINNTAAAAAAAGVAPMEPKAKRAKTAAAYNMDSAHQIIHSSGVVGGDGASHRDIDQIWSDFCYTHTQMNKTIRDGNMVDLVDENVIMVQIVRLMEIQTATALGMTLVEDHGDDDDDEYEEDVVVENIH